MEGITIVGIGKHASGSTLEYIAWRWACTMECGRALPCPRVTEGSTVMSHVITEFWVKPDEVTVHWYTVAQLLLHMYPLEWSDYSPATKANCVRVLLGSLPGFSHVGIMLDDGAGRRVFSGISRFPIIACNPYLTLTSLQPSSTLKTPVSKNRFRQPTASTGTIPTCENPGATPPRIELGFVLVGCEQSNNYATSLRVSGTNNTEYTRSLLHHCNQNIIVSVAVKVIHGTKTYPFKLWLFPNTGEIDPLGQPHIKDRLRTDEVDYQSKGSMDHAPDAKQSSGNQVHDTGQFGGFYIPMKYYRPLVETNMLLQSPLGYRRMHGGHLGFALFAKITLRWKSYPQFLSKPTKMGRFPLNSSEVGTSGHFVSQYAGSGQFVDSKRYPAGTNPDCGV
ncbi:hypothetical protein PR048_003166 [Dryococelus australis]|uniref:Uncharacterized protein n=1 Tax=Dryococelus australis TaxID=614101 RepID=A0ABQ9IM81_9NEOP|nr:hypothetical protein PR048_003166 [Dryococelus australis]